MSLLQKILLITIVGLCVGNVEEVTAMKRPRPTSSISLILPDKPLRIRGQKDELISKNVNGLPTDCFHITISPTENIYLPTNGNQPSTIEASEYSCATIEANNFHYQVVCRSIWRN